MPVLKKRREVLPVDVPTPVSDNANSAVAGQECNWPSLKVEAQLCPANLENNNSLLTNGVSVNTPGVSFFPHKNMPMDIPPVKEKKCVQLAGVTTDSEALSERSGNTPDSSRSVPSFPEDSKQTSPSLLYRCMNCAICFFIYLLSVACSLIPKFHLSSFDLSKTLRKTKMIEREKDS